MSEPTMPAAQQRMLFEELVQLNARNAKRTPEERQAAHDRQREIVRQLRAAKVRLGGAW